ncbi:MAG: enoyl-CoA hydratase [Deltaproteobacteria bacterium]|nr:enoyl-CoA hydratase [Deltaproteobacteria bacterium]
MSEDVILIQKNQGIATLTLNRPKALNAISSELSERLSLAFREIQEDRETRVAIVAGNGRAFCAGMDLKELGSGGPASRGDKIGNPLDAAMRDFEGPIIAAVGGFAVTAGFELALAADVIVASTEAQFVDSHARVGILPGWGLAVKLPQLIGIVRAKSVSLTGNPIDAETAERWGLVSQVVSPHDLMPTCEALARDMLSCDPDILVQYKELIDRCFGMTVSEALPYETAIATESARNISADRIAERREDVQNRNRSKSS